MVGEPMMPGAQYAMNVIHPGSSALRVRYRQGVLVDPYGFPDWLLYARALVELPALPALAPAGTDWTVDELRVIGVLAANRAMVGRDPLWPAVMDVDGNGGGTATPVGWCWARLPVPDGRGQGRLALVPVELHGAYRHGGGLRTLPVDWSRRGLRTDEPPVPVGMSAGDEVPADLLDALEALLDTALPPVYRRYLAGTNGAGPAAPGVLAHHGLVADQPLFGLARADRHQDISAAPELFADRLPPDLLAVGYVQGGLLAVSLSGPDTDTVWYLDDDDPRDDENLDPGRIATDLLHRCAGHIEEFWSALHRPARALVDRAAELVDSGQVRQVRDELAGSSLPAAARGPGQAPPGKKSGSLAGLFQATSPRLSG
jgi:hypothetical protein